MPFFNQQWADLLCCSVCTGKFDITRLPCSLICNHTICTPCLLSFRDGSVTKCPLDQTEQNLAVKLLPVNTSMLLLQQLDCKHSSTVQDRLRICVQIFRDESARRDYLVALETLENLANLVANAEGNLSYLVLGWLVG